MSAALAVRFCAETENESISARTTRVLLMVDLFMVSPETTNNADTSRHPALGNCYGKNEITIPRGGTKDY